ncbi:MAG: amidohydrolase family protein [Terracidiphilus sp.]
MAELNEDDGGGQSIVASIADAGSACENHCEHMRLDSHQHFWKYSPTEHVWMTDAMAVLKRNFLPQELKPLLAENGFHGSIAVQARQSLEETRWLLELAGQYDFIKGVVGWVDLCAAELPLQLKYFAAHKRLVGVRHLVQDETDDEFMMRADFRRGIAQLADFGLTYDLLLYPRHLPAAAKLVREFPDQRFVLDHIAKPAIAGGRIDDWERELRALAKFQNVSCKLSGMVTEARWNRWQPGDFRPYLDVVFDAFGANRLMIGSDWPVCTLSADYASAVCIVMNYIEGLAIEEREGVLGGNCARVYGISVGARAKGEESPGE